jgi:hypothetical protein
MANIAKPITKPKNKGKNQYFANSINLSRLSFKISPPARAFTEVNASNRRNTRFFILLKHNPHGVFTGASLDVNITFFQASAR